MRWKDIAQLAKNCDVIKDARMGLKGIVQVVLNENMKKNHDIRSSKWANTHLTREQKEYAALDAIKSHQVYKKLIELPDYSSRLSSSAAKNGIEVDVIPSSGRNEADSGVGVSVAAFGRIVDDPDWQPPEGIIQDKQFKSATRVVQIEKVRGPFLCVPGFKYSRRRRTRHHQSSTATTIGSFKDFSKGIPFRLRLPLAMLKLHNPASAATSNESEGQLADTTKDSDKSDVRWSIFLGERIISDVVEELKDDFAAFILHTLSEEASWDVSENVSENGQMRQEEMALVSYLREISHNSVSHDAASKLSAPPSQITDVFRSVLGDAWHYMDRVRVPVKHRLRKAYFVTLSEAFFAWDPTRMEQTKAALRKDGKTDEQIESMLYYDVGFFLDCVPRAVLPPSQLYWRVRNVFLQFGSKEDDRKPLFNERGWKKADNVLKEILQGYASDPPGVEMYVRKVNTKGEEMTNYLGLPIYWCLRGTGLTECHHKQFLQSVGIWATRIEMADAIRQEHRHRYNHQMAQRRRVGFPKIGHYDTWLIDAIQILVERNHGTLVFPAWVNTGNYAPTTESCGVIPPQANELTEAVNLLHIPEMPMLSREQKYLAKHQNVGLPFTPVTTKDEAKLFRMMALEDASFLQDLERMALRWLESVNGRTILPKLPVYLRAYRDKFVQNQQMEDAVKSMESEIAKLRGQTNCSFPAAANLEGLETATDQPEPVEMFITQNVACTSNQLEEAGTENE